MELERAQELQQNIAGMALVQLAHGSDDVDKHDWAIKVIGVTCDVPGDETLKLSCLIAQGKEAPESICSGEITLPGTEENVIDIMAAKTAQDTFWIIMDLFQVAIDAHGQENRERLYALAEELTVASKIDERLNTKD